MKKFFPLALLILTSCSSFKLEKNIILGEFNWVQYGNSPTRSNKAYYKVSPPFQLSWTYNAGAGFSNAPFIVADGILFVATLAGEIHLVDVETGKKIGTIGAESSVHGTSALYRNKLIIPSALGKNTLECVDLNLGKTLWKEKIGPIEASLLLVYDNLIVATLEGEVINYNLKYEFPEKIWEFKVQKPIHSSPASDGKFILFGCDDGNIYCLGIEDGKLVWKFNANSPIFAPISISNGKIYFGTLSGDFFCVDIKSGKEKWKFNTGSKIYGGCALNDTLVFFGTASGKFFALNKNNGELIWTFSAKSLINSAPVISGKTIIFGSLDKNVYAIEIENGNLTWKYETGGRIKSSPIVWKNFLIVASEDRYIYAFKTEQAK
jgi:outer membrane protein assembly factor BamB